MADSPPRYVISYAPNSPLIPDAQLGMVEEGETTDRTKGRRGTPRCDTEEGGAHKFGYPALGPSAFRRIRPPNYVIFFATNAPAAPTPKLGKAEECETIAQTEGRRGAPRGDMVPDGTPEPGHPALGSAVLWRFFSELCNILCARRPLYPTPKWDRGSNAKPPTKQRGAAERYEAIRGIYFWLFRTGARHILAGFAKII